MEQKRGSSALKVNIGYLTGTTASVEKSRWGIKKKPSTAFLSTAYRHQSTLPCFSRQMLHSLTIFKSISLDKPGQHT